LNLVADTRLAVEVRPSPNYSERRSGTAPDMLLLHYTGMPEAQVALDWLCDPASEVSCHYFVFEDGRIVQLVAEARRAWHAGVAAWAGEQDINSRSIGVEIANPGHDFGYPDFPEAQMQAVETLCQDVVERRAIAPERVLAHSDVAPSRNRDPGERLDWARLARAGVGLWIEPVPIRSGENLGPGDSGPAVAGLQRNLVRFGYSLTVNAVFDEATANAVAAFQRHFRPVIIDGRADPSTIETLQLLLQKAFRNLNSNLN
jgi:N-acetylmuramoyl-L-alanine amidase